MDDTSNLNVFMPAGARVAPSAMATISADPENTPLILNGLELVTQTFADGHVVKVKCMQRLRTCKESAPHIVFADTGRFLETHEFCMNISEFSRHNTSRSLS